MVSPPKFGNRRSNHDFGGFMSRLIFIFLLVWPSLAFAASVTITGPEEMVYTYATDKCADGDISDLPVRAFRAADGTVNLIISDGGVDGSGPNRRMTGPTLNDLTYKCPAILTSHLDPSAATYDNAEWIQATYTEDGVTIYALLHNEFVGSAVSPCATPRDVSCNYWTVTAAVSTDSGATYTHAAPPTHAVAISPYTYEFIQATAPGLAGYPQTSNIIAKGRYYYTFIGTWPYKEQACCLSIMRSPTLDDPTSWRCWDGKGFSVAFANPYTASPIPADHVCAILNFNPSFESVTYNTALKRWLAVMTWGDTWWWATSKDLIRWTDPVMIVNAPPLHGTVCPGGPSGTVWYQYVALLDPDSTSRNFETSGETAYLYTTKIHGDSPKDPCNSTLNRDLVRFPVLITR
jgi:hypothetical protein